MIRNLTTGSVFKNILFFALPYLLSYFLQTLYGMADLFIIGQYEGAASITAVSIGSQIMHMITVMIVGLAMGTTVIIAQAVGAHNATKIHSAIGTTSLLFGVVSLLFAGIFVTLTPFCVSIMSTPTEAVQGTSDYLYICFLGIPCIAAYNIIASIFRGLGDARSPMYFVAVACIANIILDYIFIGYFSFGPSSAALGTVLSQLLSVLISLVYVKRNQRGIDLSGKEFFPRASVLHDILRIGLPISMQDGFIQIAFLVITMIANLRGLTDAAAVGIVEKIISFFFLVPSSMLSTVSALGAQNIGAGKPERVRATLHYALMIAVGFGIVVSILMQFMAEPVLALFTKDFAVVVAGAAYFHGYVLDCVFAGIHFCFSGYFCAYGRSELSFLHNFISIVFARIPLAYVASNYDPYSLYPMGVATAAGSLVSVLICIMIYRYMKFFHSHQAVK